MDSELKQCPWRTVDGFLSLSEFNRFVAWLNEQVKSGSAQESSVLSPYKDASAFEEKWFVHLETRQTWRLVWPDGPFHGLFEKVI